MNIAGHIRRLAALYLALCSLMSISLSSKASDTAIEIFYLTQRKEIPPALSNLDPIITDRGVQGARLGIKDNNTTGQFTGQTFRLTEFSGSDKAQVLAEFGRLSEKGAHYFLVNLQTDTLLEVATVAANKNVLLFDAANKDDLFRQARCFSDMLHFLPSRAMRADALAQYTLKKRWQNWFLAVGPKTEDQLFAAAIKRAAKRFRMKIVAERHWKASHDARRTAQSEVPVFTQGDDYDVVVVADEEGLFGEYIAYRTWLPRPVVGTQGLVPNAWHRTHEQWGAVQLQNRFREQAGRWMTEEDYGAWLAIRAIGESATRVKGADFAKIRDYLLGDDFVLAGFKGKKLSFRKWNGQLRQPVLLAAARSMVAVAPLDGFLHPKYELDTLGFDEPEVKCASPAN